MSDPRCIAETREILDLPAELKAQYPFLYGMGLLDWTIEELLIARESCR